MVGEKNETKKSMTSAFNIVKSCGCFSIFKNLQCMFEFVALAVIK